MLHHIKDERTDPNMHSGRIERDAMISEVRNRLRSADNEDLLDRVRRGVLTPEAHAIALEELRARGENVDRLPPTPPDFVEKTPTDAPDFTWGLTIANWFLIGIVAFVHVLIREQGIPNSGGQILGLLLGGLLGAAGLALVPLAVIYVINPRRSELRLKRTYTIAGWCIVALLFYPLLKA